MKYKIWKHVIGLMSLIVVLAISNQVQARTWYNLPTYSKVKIAQNPNGQRWIYVEFMWEDQKCGPNFEHGKAVEFEIGIVPKCFLQPKGGRDNDSNCDQVMGRESYALGPDRKNCYVDIWNYWNPAPNEVIQALHSNCALDSSGDWCAGLATSSGAFLDPIGNFAVGLHDASVLKAGVKYSFRYPVEINDSSECLAANRIYPSAVQCSTNPVIMEDTFRGYYTPSSLFTYMPETFHPGWGRAQITMQTFNNSCDLPWPCDNTGKAYTCPHLIGAVNSISGCINADKHTAFWLNRLCLPTGKPSMADPKAADYIFTPGIQIDTEVCKKENLNPCCMTEQTSSDLYTHGVCCVDSDGDGYYATQSFPMYGNNAGDCNDSDSKIGKPAAGKMCVEVVATNNVIPGVVRIAGFDNSSASTGGAGGMTATDASTGSCNDSSQCPDSMCCSGFCRNLETDSLNCGSCGHVCAAEKPVCLSGCCTLGCIYPYTDCGVSVCKNLKTDPANCGMCGVRCDSGKTCVDMSCVP